MTKYQYASPEWCVEMRAILERLIGENIDALVDVDFTMCEIITEVPPNGQRVVLGAHITGKGVEFFEDERPADVIIRGDYAAMLPGARLHHRSATPEQLAAQATHSKEMAKAGRVSATGQLAAAPKPLLRALAKMHDLVAEITA